MKSKHHLRKRVYVECDDTLSVTEDINDNGVLMQSTGLFDKNGREVYESDIVKMLSGELLLVQFNHGMFEPVCYYNSDAFEKVGNAFENPELLEELK